MILEVVDPISLIHNLSRMELRTMMGPIGMAFDDCGALEIVRGVVVDGV